MLDGSASWREALKSGSVGGFLSYEEANDILNYFMFKYPSLLKRNSIGSSFEGREIFAYRLFSESEKPVMETPQALLTSLLHGNEPVTLLASIYAMGSLIEEYNRNSTEAVYLLRTRELFVIPFMNPDAYARGSAEGNFKFRKNRRPTCGLDPNSSGVDLNRNFGFKWSGDASPNPCDTEYSGTGPFSEPETASLNSFLSNHKIESALNLHSYGDMLIYPYNGDAELVLPDTHRKFYDDIQSLFKPARAGSAARTLQYLTPGEATDYFYANMSIMAMSLEIGREDDGFLPSIRTAMTIADDTFRRIKMWLQKVGPDLSDATLESLPDNKMIVAIQNSGLSGGPTDLEVIVHSDAKCGDCGAVSCSHVDGFTRVYSNVKSVEALGWTNVLEVPKCASTVLSSTQVCFIERRLSCRCFPSESPADKLNSVCERFGLQHLVRMHQALDDGGIQSSAVCIAVILLGFSFFLLRIIRKSLLNSV